MVDQILFSLAASQGYRQNLSQLRRTLRSPSISPLTFSYWADGHLLHFLYLSEMCSGYSPSGSRCQLEPIFWLPDRCSSFWKLDGRATSSTLPPLRHATLICNTLLHIVWMSLLTHSSAMHSRLARSPRAYSSSPSSSTGLADFGDMFFCCVAFAGEVLGQLPLRPLYVIWVFCRGGIVYTTADYGSWNSGW
jgi:hypothetical protein